LNSLVSEMYRVLKAGGLFSFEKTTGSDDKLTDEVERVGFIKTAKEGRIMVFVKRGDGKP
jgi:fructose-1,6-bisphosphatase